MVSLIKDLSILRKFLFINLIVFIVIGILTVAYLKSIQPGLIKKKTSNHIRVIDNTIDHIKRLNFIFNLFIWSIVLSITCIWFEVFFLISPG